MEENLLSIKGKVALVTGASKGIGEAIAHFLARAGAKVVVNSRKQEEIDNVCTDIRKHGGECIAIAANVGDPVSAKMLIDKTISAYKNLDILVNNATANPVFGPVLDCEEWAYNKIMDVNVKAPFELSKLAHPHMKSNGSGTIINISSVEALTPDEGLGIYSVSKAALNMLTKVCAKEWGPDGIRVNSICPGFIKTKFSEALWSNEKWMHMFMKKVPMKRIGTPEDIAALTLFLASDASGYCTGGIFTADGGVTI
jgi:NAD(P)-dependent dehydrogenase (short-subunit alcohol dehydrogenase family)